MSEPQLPASQSADAQAAELANLRPEDSRELGEWMGTAELAMVKGLSFVNGKPCTKEVVDLLKRAQARQEAARRAAIPKLQETPRPRPADPPPQALEPAEASEARPYLPLLGRQMAREEAITVSAFAVGAAPLRPQAVLRVERSLLPSEIAELDLTAFLAWLDEASIDELAAFGQAQLA